MPEIDNGEIPWESEIETKFNLKNDVVGIVVGNDEYW
jgi:hypothetical protein